MITRSKAKKPAIMSEVNLHSLLNLLPSFDGKKESNIQFYLQQFDELATQAKINEDNIKLIILKTKLTGSARDYLINSPDLQNTTNYADFKQKLLDKFQISYSLEKAQNTFMTIKQTPEQNISDFVTTFNNAASHYLTQTGNDKKPDAVNFLNLIKFTRFLDSIRPDIALEVRKIGPKDFQEAVDIAKRIELALNSANAQSLNNMTHENNDKKFYETLIQLSNKETEDKINKMQEELNALKIQKQTNSTNNAEKFCDICKLKGKHDTNSCWFNLKNKKNNRQSKNMKSKQNNYPTHFSQPNMYQMQPIGQMIPHTNNYLAPPFHYYPPMQPVYPTAANIPQPTNNGRQNFQNNTNSYRPRSRGQNKHTQSRTAYRPKSHTPRPKITYPSEN